MKKSIYILAVSLLTGAGMLTGCEQTDADRDKDKTPVVEYVRPCDAAARDSLLTQASLGATICLMGDNLGDVQEVYFNNIPAKLNPTLITSFSLIVNVPTTIPETENVTDLITLRTSKGHETTFPFHVVVPAPQIDAMSCEYAKPGDPITLTGNFFVDPEVYFPGVDTPAVIDENASNVTTLVVTVPAGATTEGPVRVKSLYGTSKSAFNFLDTTGLITNFDDGYVNPWKRGTIAEDGGISGKYLLFDAPALSAWGWNEAIQWGYFAYAETAHGNKPIATGDIANLCLKFEVNSSSWLDCPMVFWFGPYAPDANKFDIDDASNAQAHWKPYMNNGSYIDGGYVTNGWTTVSIPLTDFKYDKEESVDSKTIGDISNYTDLTIMVFGACENPGPMNVKIDNLRIVKIQ